MHVLIATDGTLDPGQAASFAASLVEADGKVTVVTVVEINRNLLRDLRGLFGERQVNPVDQDAEYVGLTTSGAASVGADWPGDDEMLARYLADQREARTGPLVAALEGQGIEPGVLAVEGDAAANAILATAADLNADVICVGSKGRGVFDGFLGSTSTKLARRAPTPVLILR